MTQPKSPSSSPKNLLVSYINFANGKIPIYWAPDEDTTFGYHAPPVEAWKLQTLLAMPRIVRFFFSSDAVNTSDYVAGPPSGIKRRWVLVSSSDGIEIYPGCTLHHNNYILVVDGEIRTSTSEFDMSYMCTSKSPTPRGCGCAPECNGKVPVGPGGIAEGFDGLDCPGSIRFDPVSGWHYECHGGDRC